MKLESFLPEKSHKKKLVQGFIDEEILSKANEKRRNDGLTWNELIEALCEFYIHNK